MPENQPCCVYCERYEDQVPLVSLRFRGESLWICPQHLPLLIHKPAQLAHKLPGIESLGEPEVHHH